MICKQCPQLNAKHAVHGLHWPQANWAASKVRAWLWKAHFAISVTVLARRASAIRNQFEKLKFTWHTHNLLIKRQYVQLKCVSSVATSVFHLANRLASIEPLPRSHARRLGHCELALMETWHAIANNTASAKTEQAVAEQRWYMTGVPIECKRPKWLQSNHRLASSRL